ncbi:MAG: alpha-glucosidase C-terminal domain-containing protein, partial [Syntrophales bacterium]|nr:alpha-glucosidase C-terminal domain-containing protein [Syntrophales bacterium]
LLAEIPREAQWALCDISGWPDNDSYRHLLAWAWCWGSECLLVVVNTSPHPAQGRVPWPLGTLPRGTLALRDPLSGETFIRDGAEVMSPGLFVSLGSWGYHVLRWSVPVLA